MVDEFDFHFEETLASQVSVISGFVECGHVFVVGDSELHPVD